MIRWSDAQERCGNSFVRPSLIGELCTGFICLLLQKKSWHIYLVPFLIYFGLPMTLLMQIWFMRIFPRLKKARKPRNSCKHHVLLDLRFTLNYMTFLINLEVHTEISAIQAQVDQLKPPSSGFEALWFACIFIDKSFQR